MLVSYSQKMGELKDRGLKTRLLKLVGYGFLSLGMATQAQAALIDRGAGLIYDTVLDVTWLGDANYAYTSGYDADGMMNSADANAWADQLVYGGFDDWRLPFNPQFDPTCDTSRTVNGIALDIGFGCSGSEYGHLFYEDLGGTAFSPISNSADPDLALFSNLQDYSGSEYWASTAEYWSAELNDFYTIYHHFHFSDGYQRYFDPTVEMYAMAVRDGDVLTAVPLPAAVWLFGSGIMFLLGLVHKRK